MRRNTSCWMIARIICFDLSIKSCYVLLLKRLNVQSNDFSKIQNLSMFIMLMTFHALDIFSDNHRYIFTGVITLLVIERNRQDEIDRGTTTPMIVIYSTYQVVI